MWFGAFHSDNGSEFINYTVAKLLGKLLIEQTRSRAHHCGDNGLVESNNGAIIRKHIGYGHIDAQHAEAVDQFHRQHLNPYVNFHRPCAVPKILTEPNGKRRRIYLRWATPFELLQEAPNCESLLRPGVTLAELGVWPTFNRGRPGDATRQAPTDGPHRQEERLSRWRLAGREARSAVEMAGRGQPWKTVIADAMSASRRFSSAAHRPWKTLRVSHIPTAPTTAPLSLSELKTKGPSRSVRLPPFRLILQ